MKENLYDTLVMRIEGENLIKYFAMYVERLKPDAIDVIRLSEKAKKIFICDNNIYYYKNDGRY